MQYEALTGYAWKCWDRFECIHKPAREAFQIASPVAVRARNINEPYPSYPSGFNPLTPASIVNIQAIAPALLIADLVPMRQVFSRGTDVNWPRIGSRGHRKLRSNARNRIARFWSQNWFEYRQFLEKKLAVHLPYTQVISCSHLTQAELQWLEEA